MSKKNVVQCGAVMGSQLLFPLGDSESEGRGGGGVAGLVIEPVRSAAVGGSASLNSASIRSRARKIFD